MRRSIGALLGFALVATLAGRADAQMVGGGRAFTVGISGGIAIPQGDWMEDLNNGWQAGVHLGFRPAALPVGVRFDAQYTRFSTDTFTEEMDGESFSAKGNLGVVGLTANAVIGGAGVGFRPYVIGGLGLYNLRAEIELTVPELGSVSFSDDENRFGVNGGVGIEFPLGGIGAFAEARYHTIFTKEERTSFIPITIGIRF